MGDTIVPISRFDEIKRLLEEAKRNPLPLVVWYDPIYPIVSSTPEQRTKFAPFVERLKELARKHPINLVKAR